MQIVNKHMILKVISSSIIDNPFLNRVHSSFKSSKSSLSLFSVSCTSSGSALFLLEDREFWQLTPWQLPHAARQESPILLQEQWLLLQAVSGLLVLQLHAVKLRSAAGAISPSKRSGSNVWEDLTQLKDLETDFRA